MKHPHRSPFPANTYFFTLRLAPFSDDLLTRNINILRSAMRYTLSHHPMQIDAMAVLPNTVHALWTLPPGDTDYPNRIGMLKARFSRAMPMPSNRSQKQIQRGEKGIWERRYWEHKITDNADYNRHHDLIHLSPVHGGLCTTPQEWSHSSVHRDIKRGLETPASKYDKLPPVPNTLGPPASLSLT
jgi:putative transposase